jgi:hypothetical protein
MHLHLKVINEELAKRGRKAVLVKGDGYFYFDGGETVAWLDRTVKARTINTLTLKQWIEEFDRLKELNAQILRTVKGGKPGRG